MNKRIIALLVVLALTLSACGKEDKGQLTKDQGQNKSEKVLDIEKDENKGSNKKMDNKTNEDSLGKDVVLKDYEGKEFRLSDYGGQKVYIKYWASWCPICLSGLDELNNLSSEDKEYKVFSVISPNNLGEKNKEDFVEWFDSLGYENIKILFDDSGKFVRDFNIRSAPTSLIFDGNGNLVRTIPGHIGEETIDSIFNEI